GLRDNVSLRVLVSCFQLLKIHIERVGSLFCERYLMLQCVNLCARNDSGQRPPSTKRCRRGASQQPKKLPAGLPQKRIPRPILGQLKEMAHTEKQAKSSQIGWCVNRPRHPRTG